MAALVYLMCAINGRVYAQSINSERVKTHYLPKTDVNYKGTSGYIEDVPISGYSWASDKAYEDFNDIKFGVRIHWGLYSIIHQSHESWPFLRMSNAEKQAYVDMAKAWNPQGFNAEAWMDFFKESGMKMFAFTTKHHEGFSMFDTKTRIKKRVRWDAPGGPVMEDCDLAYSIMESPFRRDIVKELCDAAREKDIKIDLYFSHTDWFDADFRPYGWHPLQIPSAGKIAARNKQLEPEGKAEKFGGSGPVMMPDPSPEEVDRMMNRHQAQLTELLTNYGKIDMVCLDIWLGPSLWPRLRETMVALRKIQPDVMFRARGIGNYGDYYTPEGFVPGSKENTSVPWFVIETLGRSFSYEPDAASHKGAKWVVDKIIDCAAKGGNFMIGIGPDENGRFHPTAVEQLKQTGRWLKRYGEAIYATRPREGQSWKENDFVKYTRSKDDKVVYAHCAKWPGEQLELNSIKAKESTKVYMLGYDEPLKWKRSASGGMAIDTPEKLRIAIPEEEQLAYAFKIVL